MKYIVVVPIAIVSACAEISQEELRDITNKLWYIDWAITATNKLSNATDDDFYKPSHFLYLSKYRESIINVIGHALADCATMSNEFALKEDEPRVITFDVDPRKYSPENWNAVVLYNYVDVLMHGKLYQEAQKKGITDVFEFIKQLLKDHYAKQKIQISDFDGKLDRAIGDIREYNDKLGIWAEITSYIINSNNKDEVRTPNYGISISDIEKQSLKDTIIFDLNRTVEIKRNNQQFIKFDLTLSYHPKASEDEKWRPIDNGTYTIDDKVGIYSGKWIRLTRCLISFFSQLIYYINYDFELDASELWAYRTWDIDPIFEYKGKMLTIESSNKNDPQYKDAIKDGTSVRIYNEEYPNGYPDFRKMDPKERPILVED